MNAKTNRVPIQENHELPSKGKLYGGNLSEITLRAMTTVEEKMRLAGSGITNIPNLIQSCTLKPENINIMDLKLFDIQYLMYKLRTLTYGPEYKLTIGCPYCGGTNNIVVNLDDVPVNDIPDDFIEPFEIGPLPVSGDILTCKILSASDIAGVEREGKRILSKFPDYVGSPEFILEYKAKIITINGEDAPQKIQKYVEQMHARDLNYFDKKYTEVTDGFGIDPNMFEVCSHCGKDINYQLSVTEEFFRPSY